jgi:flagellar basal body rod protein FlgG
MIKGLYAAASAMITGLARQNLISHNLANIETPGFRSLLSTLEDFRQTEVWSRPANENLLRQRLARYGQLGLGVETLDPVTDFEQGALRQTEQPLDVAIQGAGFFRIETPNGERYTRDGRFLRDADGGLVTPEGYRVLDVNGQPITLPEGLVAIGNDGLIRVDNTEVAQLGLAAFADPHTELAQDLPNTFSAAAAPTSEEFGTVVQGFVEQSNVNAALMMTQMVEVNRAYQAAQRLVQTQDELLGRAIQTLGRL